MVLSYILDDKFRVFYFVLSVLLLFYLVDLRIDALRLSSKKDIKIFFTLTLVLTSILSVKVANVFVVFLALFQLFSLLQVYVLKMLMARQRCEDITRLRYRINIQTAKLRLKTSNATYRKAKTIQGLFFDLFVLEETDRVTYAVVQDIRMKAACFLIDVDVYLQHPATFINQDPHIERAFAAKLEHLDQYLQYHLDQLCQQRVRHVRQSIS